MKVLFCSSEVAPFAKTGGLADVSGALPLALEQKGCRVKVVLPKYKCLINNQSVRPRLTEQGFLLKMGNAIDVHLIENDDYFNREQLYGESTGDYPDNLERFCFFCKQALILLKKINFRPEIIHCNDWQTALIPVFLQSVFKADPLFKDTKVVFTVHNLAYQGLFPKAKFAQTGLDWQLFNSHALEFHTQLNLLKGGLVFSHLINTVSPTYAREIQTTKFGCGLEPVLKTRRSDLFGIINGIDYQVWNPAQDNKIFQSYSINELKAKSINKQRLQRELGLPCESEVPLIGIVGRLAEQKGIELIIAGLDKLAKLNLQFILLGAGQAQYLKQLKKIKQAGYRHISINLGFDSTLAHKIYAGCDMFLMPSVYEPCGLGQLISFKYGTIPIVRRTGGLADTVRDYHAHSEGGNGFVFKNYCLNQMLKAINRALAVYANREKWRRLMFKVMNYDFSWQASAEEYIKLYRRALTKQAPNAKASLTG